MKSTDVGGWRVYVALAFAAVSLGLAGCAGPIAEAATDGDSATKEQIAGTDLSKLTLTEKAVQRLDLLTAKVSAAPDGSLQIPYGALIYDSDGKTWVYTNPEPQVYIRAAVAVKRIVGNVAQIASGPPAGTDIVTVGAAELFGAEFDTAH